MIYCRKRRAKSKRRKGKPKQGDVEKEEGDEGAGKVGFIGRLGALKVRDQRVPDTRPEPQIFFNTRSVPD